MDLDLERIKRFVNDPRQRRRELLKLGTVANQTAARCRPSDQGVNVADQEWDNLLILDACRYDLFEAHHEVPGQLRKTRSLGSQSREFLERNFAGGTHHDVVYISANPFISAIDDGVFHAVIDLFDDHWDEEVLTVKPESVVEATLDAHRRFPNKRLISHFMQPHHPFLGKRGQQFDAGAVTGPSAGAEKGTDCTPPVWFRLDVGDPAVHRRDVRGAYVENFKLVEAHAMELLDALDGKSVVTSDHGNLFGERLWPIPIRRHGHPPGLRHSALVDVPWHEVPFETRRETVADPPRHRDTVTDDVIRQRLGDLGYA
jgi:hypothetical protein